MSFRADISSAVRVIGNVEKAAEAVNRSAYRAINKVGEKWLTRSRREIVSRVMLTREYLDRPDKEGKPRLYFKKATPEKSAGAIIARERPTRLATYGAKQLMRAVKENKRGKRTGRAAGLYGAGDPLRGIPAGKASAGISVKVLRAGSRKRMPGAFLMPLRVGKGDVGGNGMGVFIRVGKGRRDIKHLYSLSVDQVFRGYVPEITGDVSAELQDTLTKQVEYEFKKGVR